MSERGLTDVDLANSLSKMAETTTTGELIRRAGQTKQVKVLSQRKLLEWIQTMLQQQLAGHEDVFSDAEKAQLLATTQAELARRIAREQEAEKERALMRQELDELVARMPASGGDQRALDELRQRLQQTEDQRTEAQQEVYDLHDQLKEKLALLSATIGEKDRLRDTVRRQMLRSTTLVESVLGLDDTYYGGRHARELPAREDADDQELFYHDYDVGAAIIATLSKDLGHLREITLRDQATAGEDRLLAEDLELLARLKGSSLNPIDLAEPVSALAEALAGARQAISEVQAALAAASGGRGQPIPEAPDAEGHPAEVLAAATRFVRELAAETNRQKGMVFALQRMTEEADAARSTAEEQLEQVGAGPVLAEATGTRQIRQQLEDTVALLRVAQADADASRRELERVKGQGGGVRSDLVVETTRDLAAALAALAVGRTEMDDLRRDLEATASRLQTATPEGLLALGRQARALAAAAR